jgi:hypothetical protein
VRDEHPPAPQKTNASGFTILDGERLREAWKSREP